MVDERHGERQGVLVLLMRMTSEAYTLGSNLQVWSRVSGRVRACVCVCLCVCVYVCVSVCVFVYL